MNKFQNPVLSGFNPDPSICRVGDTFYMVTSSFEYFPGVPIYKSKNLVNWELIGHCLHRDSQIDLRKVKSSGGIFAPSLRYHNNKFYMVTTEVNKLGHFYVTAKNPEGPWSDPIQVEGENFDPDLFFDNDGRVYFSYMGMGEGIKQFEIDIETGKRISEERVIWKGFEDRFCEAPHIYKIGNWYYLLVAEGGTHRTHMIVCARSKSPKGPFESCPHNPILTHRCAIFNPIFHAGHGDFVQYTDGSWWCVFLGVRTVKTNFHLGRETFLAPVTWTEDEWPVINDGKFVQLEMDVKGLKNVESEANSFIDNFDSKELDLRWNFRRNPVAETWNLTDKPGCLRLFCNENTLDDEKPLAFIGCRQKDFNCSVTVELKFDLLHDGEEAGLTVISNEEHHYEIAVIKQNGSKNIILRKRIGDLQAVVAKHPFADKNVLLKIEAAPEFYVFSVAQASSLKANHEWITLGKGMTRYLSAQIHDGFTGVYFGMYATGNGKKSGAAAKFYNLKYKS